MHKICDANPPYLLFSCFADTGQLPLAMARTSVGAMSECKTDGGYFHYQLNLILSDWHLKQENSWHKRAWMMVKYCTHGAVAE